MYIQIRHRVHLVARGPFSLQEASRFLCGFAPLSGGACARDDLRLAFLADRTFLPVVASLREGEGEGEGEGESGTIVADVVGEADTASVERQLARIFCLDHDGSAWPAVGARDPRMGELQARYPGLRPVCFPSPYEAAVWGVLAARTGMARAAVLRRSLAAAHGTKIDDALGGADVAVLPSPRQMLALRAFPGLSAEKIARLHAVARAALDGSLDAERLRGMPAAAALAELRAIRGVGAWTAAHVLVRGTGTLDEPAFDEPRVVRAVELVYGLSADAAADQRTLDRLSSAWRPYRTWAAVLLAVHLSRTGGWRTATRRRS